MTEGRKNSSKRKVYEKKYVNFSLEYQNREGIVIMNENRKET